MFGIADYGAFVVAIIVFLAIPGPGNLALLTATGKGGVRSGMAATLGVIAGDQALLWMAVAGLSAVLVNYPSLYNSIKWVGAAYLIGLGYSLFKSQPGDAPVLNMKAGHYFRQSLFITLLNPKAIVFYMAFFPLFVDPAIHQGLVTFGVMAGTIALLTLGYGLVVVLLAHHLAERVRANPIISVILNRVAGALLIGFGLKLALFK
ncbi:MAG: LysE family translocator [Limnohabitans sp.]|jgi:threonine/homoserine/homoserine lactone efflux protein|nr:LysE family translocator [Limnohabitans sp.]